MTFTEAERAYPEHEIIVYRNLAFRSPDFPTGIQFLIAVPNAKIAAAARPPFWRHGETIEIKPNGSS